MECIYKIILLFSKMFFTGSYNVDKHILLPLLCVNDAFVLIIACRYSKNIINNCKKLHRNKKLDKTYILHKMCRNNKYECAKLLMKNIVDINETNECGSTPLHHVCGAGQGECTELLINAGCTINEKDYYGLTGLHVACSFGYSQCVEPLVKNGADVNAVCNYGNSALNYACDKYGDTKCVEILLGTNIDINIVNRYGCIALFDTLFQKNKMCAKLLIKKGIDINYKSKISGSTILHIAIESGHTWMVELLIAAKVNINQINNNGKTALDLAKQNKRYECIKLLSSAKN
jgi:ankyrin repeat protein